MSKIKQTIALLGTLFLLEEPTTTTIPSQYATTIQDNKNLNSSLQDHDFDDSVKDYKFGGYGGRSYTKKTKDEWKAQKEENNATE